MTSQFSDPDFDPIQWINSTAFGSDLLLNQPENELVQTIFRLQLMSSQCSSAINEHIDSISASIPLVDGKIDALSARLSSTDLLRYDSECGSERQKDVMKSSQLITEQLSKLIRAQNHLKFIADQLQSVVDWDRKFSEVSSFLDILNMPDDVTPPDLSLMDKAVVQFIELTSTTNGLEGMPGNTTRNHQLSTSMAEFGSIVAEYLENIDKMLPIEEGYSGKHRRILFSLLNACHVILVVPVLFEKLSLYRLDDTVRLFAPSILSDSTISLSNWSEFGQVFANIDNTTNAVPNYYTAFLSQFQSHLQFLRDAFCNEDFGDVNSELRRAISYSHQKSSIVDYRTIDSSGQLPNFDSTTSVVFTDCLYSASLHSLLLCSPLLPHEYLPTLKENLWEIFTNRSASTKAIDWIDISVKSPLTKIIDERELPPASIISMFFSSLQTFVQWRELILNFRCELQSHFFPETNDEAQVGLLPLSESIRLIEHSIIAPFIANVSYWSVSYVEHYLSMISRIEKQHNIRLPKNRLDFSYMSKLEDEGQFLLARLEEINGHSSLFIDKERTSYFDQPSSATVVTDTLQRASKYLNSLQLVSRNLNLLTSEYLLNSALMIKLTPRTLNSVFDNVRDLLTRSDNFLIEQYKIIFKMPSQTIHDIPTGMESVGPSKLPKDSNVYLSKLSISEWYGHVALVLSLFQYASDVYLLNDILGGISSSLRNQEQPKFVNAFGESIYPHSSNASTNLSKVWDTFSTMISPPTSTGYIRPVEVEVATSSGNISNRSIEEEWDNKTQNIVANCSQRWMHLLFQMLFAPLLPFLSIIPSTYATNDENEDSEKSELVEPDEFVLQPSNLIEQISEYLLVVIQSLTPTDHPISKSLQMVQTGRIQEYEMNQSAGAMYRESSSNSCTNLLVHSINVAEAFREYIRNRELSPVLPAQCSEMMSEFLTIIRDAKYPPPLAIIVSSLSSFMSRSGIDRIGESESRAAYATAGLESIWKTDLHSIESFTSSLRTINTFGQELCKELDIPESQSTKPINVLVQKWANGSSMALNLKARTMVSELISAFATTFLYGIIRSLQAILIKEILNIPRISARSIYQLRADCIYLQTTILDSLGIPLDPLLNRILYLLEIGKSKLTNLCNIDNAEDEENATDPGNGVSGAQPLTIAIQEVYLRKRILKMRS